MIASLGIGLRLTIGWLLVLGVFMGGAIWAVIGGVPPVIEEAFCFIGGVPPVIGGACDWRGIAQLITDRQMTSRIIDSRLAMALTG